MNFSFYFLVGSIDIGYENTYYEPLKICSIKNYLSMKIEENILMKIENENNS